MKKIYILFVLFMFSHLAAVCSEPVLMGEYLEKVRFNSEYNKLTKQPDVNTYAKVFRDLNAKQSPAFANNLRTAPGNFAIKTAHLLQ